MHRHKILLYTFPQDKIIQVDSIQFTKAEWLLEIIETINRISEHENIDFIDDAKDILNYYGEFVNNTEYPYIVIIKYIEEMIKDDYVLEYLENNANIVFTVDELDIKYELLGDVFKEKEQFAYDLICKFLKKIKGE